MKVTREIKTAILVIASILLFIWGYSFLKGNDLFDDSKKLFVEYDNVDGVVNSTPVTISGKVIGKVNGMILKPNGKNVVELQITDEDFPISKSSIAEIYDADMLGTKKIAIIPNFNDKSLAMTGDFLKSGVKLSLTAAVGDKLEPLQVKLDKVLANADGMLTNINQILDTRTQNNLKQAIEQLNATLAKFNSLAGNVDKLVVDNKATLGSAVSNLDETMKNFKGISSDLEKAKLGETVKQLDATLANVNKIMAGIDSGNGTIGKLMKDEAAYNNLNKAMKELELLLQDLRLHPTRYVNVSVFGKKEKPYVEPQPKN